MRSYKVCFETLACVFAAANISQAAWQPGLKGGFNTAGTAAYTTLPVYTKTYLDVHCATNYNGETTTHSNPVPIWSNNRCWQYWVQIYLPAGTTTFGANIDDNSQLKINGVTVFTQSGYNKISGAVSFDAPGWHNFLFTCGNGIGGAGPWGGTGLEQQTIGGTTVGVGFGVMLSGETIWAFPADPGDRSLFRFDDGLGFDDIFTIAGVPGNIGKPSQLPPNEFSTSRFGAAKEEC